MSAFLQVWERGISVHMEMRIAVGGRVDRRFLRSLTSAQLPVFMKCAGNQ